MSNLLGINIRQFNDEYVDESGNIDIDKMISDFTAENDIPVPEAETPEVETETEVEMVEDTEPEMEQELESEPENTPDSTQVHTEEKRTSDQAFAEMRRQLEANEPIAKWVQDLAVQQGFQNPQELIEAYEEQQLAREAEEQGVPVDVYQRLHRLEKENKESSEQAIRNQFNYEVEATRGKYNLNEEQLSHVFSYMAQQGYEAGSIPFEDAYVLANRDHLLKDAEERGRQTYLEKKQKQQQQATPHIGTNAADKQSSDDLDYSKEAIFKTFSDMGIDID